MHALLLLYNLHTRTSKIRGVYALLKYGPNCVVLNGVEQDNAGKPV